jgi:hypothetical protein
MIMAWAKLGPVLKLIIAFITGMVKAEPQFYIATIRERLFLVEQSALPQPRPAH